MGALYNTVLHPDLYGSRPPCFRACTAQVRKNTCTTRSEFRSEISKEGSGASCCTTRRYTWSLPSTCTIRSERRERTSLLWSLQASTASSCEAICTKPTCLERPSWYLSTLLDSTFPHGCAAPLHLVVSTHIHVVLIQHVVTVRSVAVSEWAAVQRLACTWHCSCCQCIGLYTPNKSFIQALLPSRISRIGNQPTN